MPAPLALTLGEPAGIGPDITFAAWRRRAELDARVVGADLVPVDQGHGPSVSIDGVVRADVAVADDLAGEKSGPVVVAPHWCHRNKAGRGVVQVTEQDRHAGQHLLGPGPFRCRARLAELPGGAGKNLALDEAQDLMALVVDPDHPGRPLEPHRLQVAQEGVHGRCPGNLRAMDAALRAEHLPATVARRQFLLGHLQLCAAVVM